MKSAQFCSSKITPPYCTAPLEHGRDLNSYISALLGYERESELYHYISALLADEREYE